MKVALDSPGAVNTNTESHIQTPSFDVYARSVQHSVVFEDDAYLLSVRMKFPPSCEQC